MPGRNCIIVHGCPSDAAFERDPETRSYDKHWIPWIRDKLIERGIPTAAPVMPDPWAPNYANYKHEFDKQLVTEATILIGHSCGCAFLVRWLAESKQAIDTLVLVAPWKIARFGCPHRLAFYDFTVDATITSRVRRIIMFTSDTESDDGKRSLAIYRAALGGEVVDLPCRGHYTHGDMGTCAFPELLEQAAVDAQRDGDHAI